MAPTANWVVYSAAMASRKKSDEEEIHDNFNCSIDSWRRHFSLGIDRLPAPRENTSQAHREMDRIVVIGAAHRACLSKLLIVRLR